jgi:hypothetical protein
MMHGVAWPGRGRVAWWRRSSWCCRAVLPAPAVAQERVQANWPLAERFTTEALRPVLFTQSVTPRWIAGTDSLWYSWKDRNGTRFMLVVPRSRTRVPLFDHEQFAADLSDADAAAVRGEQPAHDDADVRR